MSGDEHRSPEELKEYYANKYLYSTYSGNGKRAAVNRRWKYIKWRAAQGDKVTLVDYGWGFMKFRIRRLEWQPHELQVRLCPPIRLR